MGQLLKKRKQLSLEGLIYSPLCFPAVRDTGSDVIWEKLLNFLMLYEVYIIITRGTTRITVCIHTYIHNMLQSVLFWNVCLQITTFLQPSLWSQYTYLSKNLPECEVTDMHAYIICMLCKWDFLFHGISKSGMACLCLNLHYCVKSSKIML